MQELVERMHLAKSCCQESSQRATASDEEAFKNVFLFFKPKSIYYPPKRKHVYQAEGVRVELRDIKAQSSVNEERLSSELETANATISKLEQGGLK